MNRILTAVIAAVMAIIGVGFAFFRPSTPTPARWATDVPEAVQQDALDRGAVAQAGARASRAEGHATRLERRLRVLKRAMRHERKVTHHLHHELKLPIIYRVGKELERRGFRVSESPYFGGVEPVHATHSDHYPPCSCAVDVNWEGADEAGHLDWLYAKLRSWPRVKQLLWRVPDHYTHLHLSAV